MSLLRLFRRRNLPILFFTVPALFILFSYFTGIFKETSTTIGTWPITLANFAVILGVFTLVRYHSTKIVKLEEGWYYNAILLLSLFITFGAALAYQPLYNWILDNVIRVLRVALTAFVGFYNFTLFYRATKVRNIEIAVLIVSSIFVMFWMAPIGAAIHPSLPVIGKWINDVPNGGAMRGILISIAIGMIGLFIRSILGYEKSYLGGE